MASSELISTIKTRLLTLETQINDIRLRADVPYRINDKVETVSGMMESGIVDTLSGKVELTNMRNRACISHTRSGAHPSMPKDKPETTRSQDILNMLAGIPVEILETKTYELLNATRHGALHRFASLRDTAQRVYQFTPRDTALRFATLHLASQHGTSLRHTALHDSKQRNALSLETS